MKFFKLFAGNKPDPKHLMELDWYPKIRDYIKLSWGTLDLDSYITELLTDTKDHTRQGFTPQITEALIQLQLANLQLLEENGIVKDTDSLLDSRFDFGNSKWELPKNF